LLTIAILGICAAVSNQPRGGYYIALGLGSICQLVAALGIYLWMRQQKDEKTLKPHMSHIWNTCSDSLAYSIQTIGQCCGFNNYADRIMNPCVEWAPEIGCYEAIMRDVYLYTIKLAAIPYLVMIGLSAAATVAFAVEFLVHRSNTKQDPLVAKVKVQRQPFDAWQKAVFQ
jgi:hypothetical protein